MIDELIWVLGDLAARALPLVLWTMASVGVVLLVGVGGLVSKGKRSGEIAGDDLGEPEPPDSDATDAPRTFDLRVRSAPASDRKAFRDGLKGITKSLHLSSPYQVPWFLVLGQELGGKTTALASSRLDNPLGEPTQVRPGLQWWYYDRAQLLDIPGSYVLDDATTTSDRSAWFGLLSLLRSHRSRRPADSIVLVVPSTELTDYDESDEAAQRNLLWRGEFLRRKLWQAQERLGMRLPVYVVVTQGDRIDGYDAFLASVPRSAHRQMVGWSNPAGTDVEYSPSQVEDAFTSFDSALARHEDRLISSESRASDPEPLDVLTFRRGLGRLQTPLQLVLDQIFVTGALYEPFPLRGIYVTGGTGFARGAYHPEPDTHAQVSLIDDRLSWKILSS
ncbi:MAG: type VI secretion protein IcmF/TssM N-terminal domain-containing protein, partial [Acidobacteriota bacterium]